MSESEFEQQFRLNFSLVAFHANRHLIDHMRRMRKELGTDLDTIFVFGILAHLNVAITLHPGCAPEEILDEAGTLSTTELVPQRLSDIAQICGLPRETVRRKLNHLQSLGWVDRNAEGNWLISVEKASSALFYNFTRETVRRLLRVSDVVKKLMPASSGPIQSKLDSWKL